tara:strand:+ start:3896 stop:4006 length:111 start_codon:yes stop_codon:yes gene_type:complete
MTTEATQKQGESELTKKLVYQIGLPKIRKFVEPPNI